MGTGTYINILVTNNIIMNLLHFDVKSLFSKYITMVTLKKMIEIYKNITLKKMIEISHKKPDCMFHIRLIISNIQET
uniref:Uncharacterized protein n=1 Tax=Pinctada fucata TaxID=50426 RepID=A0A194AQL7_PINFU